MATKKYSVTNGSTPYSYNYNGSIALNGCFSWEVINGTSADISVNTTPVPAGGSYVFPGIVVLDVPATWDGAADLVIGAGALAGETITVNRIFLTQKN